MKNLVVVLAIALMSVSMYVNAQEKKKEGAKKEVAAKDKKECSTKEMKSCSTEKKAGCCAKK